MSVQWVNDYLQQHPPKWAGSGDKRRIKYHCKTCGERETWSTVGPVYHACPALPAGTGRMTELVPVRPKQRKPWTWALNMVEAGWYPQENDTMKHGNGARLTKPEWVYCRRVNKIPAPIIVRW